MDRDELERLWADDRNWTRLGFYRCAEDPRLIVPKRIKWTGWTANIAHGFSVRSIWPFVFILTAALVPLAAVILFQKQPTWLSVGIALAVSLGLVCAVCHWHASQAAKKRP